VAALLVRKSAAVAAIAHPLLPVEADTALCATAVSSAAASVTAAVAALLMSESAAISPGALALLPVEADAAGPAATAISSTVSSVAAAASTISSSTGSSSVAAGVPSVCTTGWSSISAAVPTISSAGAAVAAAVPTISSAGAAESTAVPTISSAGSAVATTVAAITGTRPASAVLAMREPAAVATAAHTLLPVVANSAFGTPAKSCVVSTTTTTGALDIIAVRASHGFGLHAAVDGGDCELERLALQEAAEPCRLDRSLMHEVLLPVLVAEDEPESFVLHPLRALSSLHVWI